jgi:hypothetical protein
MNGVAKTATVIIAIVLGCCTTIGASWHAASQTKADLRVYVAKDEAEKASMKETIVRIEKMVRQLYEREFEAP